MDALDRLVTWYEALSPASLGAMTEFYTPDAYFRDPFNEVRGIPEIRRIFEHMFESLHEPRFAVVNRIAEGPQAMLEWDFTFRIRRFRPNRGWSVHGTTHLRFTDDGRVGYHRDYWDVADELYAKLPLIGPMVRFMKRQLA